MKSPHTRLVPSVAIKACLFVPAFAMGLAAAACTSSDEPTPCDGVPSDSEACLNHRYLAPVPTSAATCTGVASSQRIDDRREVAFFRGASVADPAVVSYGQGLQGFYQPYGLTFFTRRAPVMPDINYAINGTEEEVENLEKQAGIVPGEPPTPAQKAKLEKLTSELLFGPLRDFIVAQSELPHDRVNIVVLGSVVAPAIARSLKGVVGGLGLSPRLLREVAGEDPSKDLFKLLGLPADFTPALFIAHSDISRLGANGTSVVAHEMGHALGLQHSESSGNIMKQGVFPAGCTPNLSNSQVMQIRQGLTVGAEARESWDEVFMLRDRLVARALQHAWTAAP